MKYLIPLLILAGCADKPPTVPVKVDPQAQQMSRNEVVQASMECEAGNLRPVPIISKRMVSGMYSDIVIDVQCMPKRSSMY